MRIVAASRRNEIARLRRLIERMHSPRLYMMLIVALTAAVGFLASFAFLHSGVSSLWLRYPVAIAVAYLAFLFFLWCWLRLRRHDVLDGLDIPSPGSRSGSSYSPENSWEPGGGQFGGGGASSSFDDNTQLAQLSSESGSSSSAGSSGLSDAAGAFDLEELTFVLLAIAALIGAVWTAIWIVWAAPMLLAELMLDAALATGLYRRLRDVEGNHWLRTAVRRTVWPFIAVALLFSLAGGSMQIYAPDAKSIGHVLQHYKETR
jgi:hypothetical protein